ncbi:MAG: hypothetical protein ABSE68_00525 [Minisyncoccia bacterium]
MKKYLFSTAMAKEKIIKVIAGNYFSFFLMTGVPIVNIICFIDFSRAVAQKYLPLIRQ